MLDYEIKGEKRKAEEPEYILTVTATDHPPTLILTIKNRWFNATVGKLFPEG